MPDYRRLTRGGATYFFTVVTYKRRPYFHSLLARDCLGEAWRGVASLRPFVTQAPLCQYE